MKSPSRSHRSCTQPAVLFLLALPVLCAAQTSEPSSLEALPLSGSVSVDGRLSDQPWSAAPHISNFTQRELDFGAPVSERTEVAVLFDEDALYVGFWGYDREPSSILAKEMARDFSWSGEDNFEVVLDPFDDNRNGYLFVINPNGAMADALLADNGDSMNRDWDGVWAVETEVTDEGWFAELRIPFSTLRFDPRSESGWGINFERNIRRKREQVLWQGWSRDYDLEQVSRAGALTGLSGLGSVRLVDVRPHAVGGVEWRDAEERDGLGDAGVDVLYQPTPAWRVNVTANPDFAQVESDREEVNLSRFPLFFPERREFFLEGQEFFDFQIGSDSSPFYSRRIGLAADRTEIPILGGARVLGRRGGSTLGAMVLQTQRRGESPSTNFGVVRWKQDVLEESSVGVLGVSRLGAGRSNFTYGVDLSYATSELFAEKAFEFGLTLAQTYTSDAPDQSGLAHRLFVGYPNDLVEFSASWTRADSAFNPEVGFVRRASYQRLGSELAILPRPEFLPFIQQMEFKPWGFSWYIDDVSHDLQTFDTELVPLAFTTRSGESFELALSRGADRLEEPFELFDDAEEIPVGTYWETRWLVEMGTFSGRPLSFDASLSSGDYYLGTRDGWSLSGRWKASKHLTLSGDFEHNQITLAEDELGVDEVAGRADFAFTPTLFGAVSGQWNNEDDEVIANFRLNWIPRPGSNLFLVINNQAETEGSHWNPTRSTVLTKLVWRIAF